MTTSEAPGHLLFAKGLLEPQVDIFPPCPHGCCFPVNVEIYHSHGSAQYPFQITYALVNVVGKAAALGEAVRLARAKHAAMRGALISRN